MALARHYSLFPALCVSRRDWAIALGEVGRNAIFADAKWAGGYYALDDLPRRGLAAARQLAMLSYRSPASFSAKFRRQAWQRGRGRGQASAAGPPDAVNEGGEESSSAPGPGACSRSCCCRCCCLDPPPLQRAFCASPAVAPPRRYEVERYLAYQVRQLGCVR